MKTFTLCATVLVMVFGTAQATPEITSQDAQYFFSKQAVVCGKVSQVFNAKKALFINLDGVYPNQAYTFVIWKSDYSRFRNWPNLVGSEGYIMCAKGKVEQYKGKYQTVVETPSQLSFK